MAGWLDSNAFWMDGCRKQLLLFDPAGVNHSLSSVPATDGTLIMKSFLGDNPPHLEGKYTRFFLHINYTLKAN